MTVSGERTMQPQTGVLNLSPLKKSASFTVSVDKIETKPARNSRIFIQEPVEEGEEWSGEEEDEVEEVIIPGTDWESVNYVYKKFGCEVSETKYDSLRNLIAFYLKPNIVMFWSRFSPGTV